MTGDTRKARQCGVGRAQHTPRKGWAPCSSSQDRPKYTLPPNPVRKAGLVTWRLCESQDLGEHPQVCGKQPPCVVIEMGQVSILSKLNFTGPVCLALYQGPALCAGLPHPTNKPNHPEDILENPGKTKKFPTIG